MAHDWHRGFLLPEEWPENWETAMEALHPATININGNTVTKDQIETLMKFEKPILAYTINDPERARLLQSWGVDGFFSDTPDVIVDSLLSVH